MILAGDIGGTNARLALFDVKNGRFNLVSSTVFPSRQYSGLDEIVKEFVSKSGAHPAQACFGVAGPVTNGRVEASNLPWIIESRRLADELELDHALLINDLEATGWYSVFAPAKTPTAVVARYSKVLVDALATPEVKSKLLGFGLIPTGTTPAEFAAIQKSDSEKWAPAVKASGFTPEQ
jgi:hypothetical protein